MAIALHVMCCAMTVNRNTFTIDHSQELKEDDSNDECDQKCARTTNTANIGIKWIRHFIL